MSFIDVIEQHQVRGASLEERSYLRDIKGVQIKGERYFLEKSNFLAAEDAKSVT